MGWTSQVVLVVKKPPAIAGGMRDVSSIPRLGRSPGGGHDNSLQHSCLGNPMDRGAWWAEAHRVAKSWTQLKRLSACTRVLGWTQRSLGFSTASCKCSQAPPRMRFASVLHAASRQPSHACFQSTAALLLSPFLLPHSTSE